MTWKAHVNEALWTHSEGHLCLDCLAVLLPQFNRAQISTIVRQREGSPWYVSRYEAACSRCGKHAEVFACG